MFLAVYFPLIIVIIGTLFPIIKGLKSTDRSELFSPLVFAGIVLFYYVVLSYFTINKGDIILGSGISKAMWGAALYIVSYHISFCTKPRYNHFKRINVSFNSSNALFTRGITLFLIGFVAYTAIKGFSFSVIKEQEYSEFDPNASYGQITAYLSNLISLFPVAICLVFASNSRVKHLVMAIMIILDIVIAITGGSRFVLALLLLTLFVFIYIYPIPKRPQWIIIIPIVIVFYFSMGIIEKTRNYGSGLDREKLLELDREQVSGGASEGVGVFQFSADVMERYDKNDLIYFEPFVNALMFPLPRKFFPNKPKGIYMREANIRVYGDVNRGAAFLNYTEGYISFGWLGVILYGLFFGVLARIFWSNYQRNRSIGSILLLASFNAWIYVLISRGYMAQAFMNFLYYIFVPFWISWLIDLFPHKRLNK